MPEARADAVGARSAPASPCQPSARASRQPDGHIAPQGGSARGQGTARTRLAGRARRGRVWRGSGHVCFAKYMATADRFYSHGLGDIEKGWNEVAAFELHQATEHYYKCAILVVTAYWPKEHNIAPLRACENVSCMNVG